MVPNVASCRIVSTFLVAEYIKSNMTKERDLRQVNFIDNGFESASRFYPNQRLSWVLSTLGQCFVQHPVPEWEKSPCPVRRKHHHLCRFIPPSRPSETTRQQGFQKGFHWQTKHDIRDFSKQKQKQQSAFQTVDWLESNRACVRKVTNQRLFF